MSYIGQGLPADSFQGFVTDSFTGDGSATTFTLSKEPFSEDTLIVVINNVIQKPTTNFTVSGTTLTIVGTAVASGDVIYAIHTGGPLPIGGAAELDLNGASDKLVLDADGDTTISADTDDQIDFKAGGTDVMSMTATGLTINDGVVITTADNTDTLTLKSTDADAVEGPNLILQRDSASPADSDDIARIDFDANNDAGEVTRFITLRGNISDASDGSEDAQFLIQQMIAGSNVNTIRVKPDEIVFNDSSIDLDLRVESDINTASLIVEGSSGHVGFGVSNPSSVIDVRNGVGERQAFVFMGVNQDTVAMAVMSSYALSSQTATMIQFLDFNGTERGSIKTSGSATAYNTSSDYRLKENINYDWDATTELKKLKPAKFNWKVDTENTVEGFLAHEVSDIVPDAITGKKDETETKTKVIRDSANQILGEGIEEADWIAGKVDGKYPSDSTWQASETKEKYQQIDQSKLVPLMVKTIQELEARIKTLEDA
jgi:hypothetical protein